LGLLHVHARGVWEGWLLLFCRGEHPASCHAKPCHAMPRHAGEDAGAGLPPLAVLRGGYSEWVGAGRDITVMEDV
jgi:hypothetical protein